MKQHYFVFNENLFFVDRVLASCPQDAATQALRCPGFGYRNDTLFQPSKGTTSLWRMNFTRPGEQEGTRERCCTDVYVFDKEEVKGSWMASRLQEYL